MKKTVIGVVVVLLIAAAGAGVYLMQNLDGIVKEMVEQTGTEATNTQVRVREVKVNLTEGEATLLGLTVANPPGFSAEPLLSLEQVKVAIDTSSLTGPVYVIKTIRVDGVRVLAEQKGTGINIQTLMDGMPDEDGSAGDSQGSSDADTKMAISEIIFGSGTMELRSEQFDSQMVDLGNFSLSNIGTVENGLTPDEVAEEIARKWVVVVRDKAKSALASYLRKEAASQLKEKLKDKLGSLFNRDED